MDKTLKNDIALIIPFFGKWPEWIDLYFHSCKRNKFIDWYFFTDCIIPAENTDNLHFTEINFTDYCQKVSLELGFQFKPHSPYKLCGLKPFYGFIHRDIVAGYDFWGFGDVDTVWGDLSKFYTSKMLEQYDIFSTHSDRVSGHLAIIRNEPKYTEMCFRIADWKEKLEDEATIALDEQDFTWLIFPESRYISKFYSKIIRKLFNWRNAWVIYYNLIPILNWILRLKKRRLYFKEQHTTPILGGDGRSFKHDSEKWIYKNGKIVNAKNNQEYIYLHFMIYKKNSFRETYFWKGDNYQFPANSDFTNKKVIIDSKGFYEN